MPTCPSKEAIQAPVWTRGPSLPSARPPPTEPMLPNICKLQEKVHHLNNFNDKNQ